MEPLRKFTHMDDMAVFNDHLVFQNANMNIRDKILDDFMYKYAIDFMRCKS